MRDKACPHCNRPLMEIDHYGEVLVGCIDCNCWGHLDDDKLIMELMGSDLEALKGVRHDGGYKSRHDWASHGADATGVANATARLRATIEAMIFILHHRRLGLFSFAGTGAHFVSMCP